MSLQRGENIRGWEGVTRDLSASSDEKTAWTFLLFSFVLTLIVAGLAALFLSKSDIPTVAKALLSLGVLLFTLVFISATYSTMVRRASAEAYDEDIEAGRATGASQPVEDLVMEEPSLETVRQATPMGAMPAASAAPAEPAPVIEPQPAPEPIQAAMAGPMPEPVAEATPEPAQTADSAVDPGVRPMGLGAARNGAPDDLTLVKGIGPKLAELCHSLGFFHFDQIAAWTDEEIAWVDQNLEGFKGRVSRDEWVSQAKILAEGGQTEFSERQKDS